MIGRFELALGLLIWCGVLWDGFATVVLPRTVDPTRRLSARFTRWSWRLWASVGRGIRQPGTRLSFLAVYGPLSVMVQLALSGVLMIAVIVTLIPPYASWIGLLVWKPFDELFIGAIQAFIFALLTIMYLGMGMSRDAH